MPVRKSTSESGLVCHAVEQIFAANCICALVHAKPSTFDAGGQDSARMQSLPLYEAKPATLVEQRQSARMSLFIVIDLRDGILVPEAPGPRRAVGGAARRANASDIRGASAVGFNASARPDARLRSSSRAAPQIAGNQAQMYRQL